MFYLLSFLVLSVSLYAHAQGIPIMLKGHSGSVDDIAFSPDGTTLASAGGGPGDHKVRLWEVPSGQPKFALSMPGAENVAFSPDGATLAAGSSIGTIFLWDIGAGQPDSYTQIDYPKHTAGASIDFSPDGKLLARGSLSRGVLLLWEFGRDEPKILLDDELVFCVAFSPDGKLLASGLAGVIALWDVSGLNASWGVSKPFKGTLGSRGSNEYNHTASAIAFSPDGKLLASANDRTVRLWNVETGQFQTVKGGVASVAFSPDGKLLASASNDRTVRLWNVETGQTQAVLEGHSDGVASVAFSPDGKLLASGSYDGTIRFWEDVQGSND